MESNACIGEIAKLITLKVLDRSIIDEWVKSEDHESFIMARRSHNFTVIAYRRHMAHRVGIGTWEYSVRKPLKPLTIELFPLTSPSRTH